MIFNYSFLFYNIINIAVVVAVVFHSRCRHVAVLNLKASNEYAHDERHKNEWVNKTPVTDLFENTAEKLKGLFKS